MNQKPTRKAVIISGAGALLVFLTIYLLRMDRVIGLYMDDAWYVLLAKSLATGQGYTLINSPSPGILPSLYPPAYPFLLSLVFLLKPQFPENVWMLKSVSLVAMLGVGITSYLYFYRIRKQSHYLALGIALAAVLCPEFVFLMTANVLSEGVYTLGSLLTIILIERGVHQARSAHFWRYAVAGGVLASFTFLTRSIALGLVVAVFCYLLGKRLPRIVLLFTFVVALCVGSWKAYAYVHAPTPAQLAEQNGYISQNYNTQFWQRKASIISSGWITAADLPGRVVQNLKKTTGRAVEIAVWGIFRQWDVESDSVSLFSFILSALILTGFICTVREQVTLVEIYLPITLLIILLWPWDPVRFVVPLTPFMIFYFFVGLRHITALLRRWTPTLNQWNWRISVSAAVWVIVVMNILGNTLYIGMLYGFSSMRSGWTETFEESEKTLEWVRQNVPQDVVIASDNPAMIHLFTGHRTISSDEPDKNIATWNRLGVRYLVGPWYRQFVLPAPNSQDGKYKTLFTSGPNANLWVVDFGEEVASLPWIVTVATE